ncbi:MAG: DUF429 domain-containing protein [Acidimicrobiales bacterium]
MSFTRRALGVDGARGGWLVAEVDLGDPTAAFDFRFQESLHATVRSLRPGDVMIVDMPIGLSDDGDRPVDLIARNRLGSRRSTFFPTPHRASLDAHSWAEANASSRIATGRGMSKQSWNLIPKIREIDSLWNDTLEHVVLEGHPESSFAEMLAEPIAAAKRTSGGRRVRRDALSREFGVRIAGLDEVPARFTIDAIDAAALCWTAMRVADGSAIRLGADHDRDAIGHPMWLTI